MDKNSCCFLTSQNTIPKYGKFWCFYMFLPSPNGGNSCKKNMEIPGGNLTVTGKLENGEFIKWGDYHPSTFTGLIQGPFPTWILYHANMAVNPAKKRFRPSPEEMIIPSWVREKKHLIESINQVG